MISGANERMFAGLSIPRDIGTKEGLERVRKPSEDIDSNEIVCNRDL